MSETSTDQGQAGHVAGEAGSSPRWPGRALRKALADAEAAPGLGAHRLHRCWQKEVGGAFSAASVLHLAEVEEPLDAFWQVSAVVRELRFPRPGQLTAMDILVKDLMLAAALTVSDRLVRARCEQPSVGGSGVVVPMTDLLAAAVVACSWLDVPLTIRWDASSGAPRAVSVIDDHPPLEFGTEAGSAQGVMRQELQAFLARHFGQGQVQAGISVQNLIAGLRQLRRSQNLAPIVALRQADASHPLRTADERQVFTATFGVPVFEYGIQAQQDQSAALHELESDLLLHLQNSLQNLFMTHSEETPMKARTKVFISYAHEDETWRDTLRMVLRPQERKGLLDVWDDKRIRTGDDWRKSIDDALASCRIAVLLVSMPFLASDFINDAELPEIFQRHADEGLWIYPILIGPCDWEGEDLLASKQMKLCNGGAFKKAPEADREEAFAAVAKEIRERLTGMAA